MKRLLIILILVSPFSFADTGKTISLECKLTEWGKTMYMQSEEYKNNYSEFAAKFDEKTAKTMALAFMRLHYEFTLEGIEVDKDIDDTAWVDATQRVGVQYEWETGKLQYRSYLLSFWTLATIDREDLTYGVTQIDMGTTKPSFSSVSGGKCKIIQLERKF